MYIVAITGASGSIIGIRTIVELVNSGMHTAVIVSAAGRTTCAYELCGNKTGDCDILRVLTDEGLSDAALLTVYDNTDFFTPPASGSADNSGLIIAPASMKTIASIAHGFSDTLITRAADVNLKEKRPLVLVPRESPLNSIHIENMLRVKQAGADIVLPVPAFYLFPRTIDDVVNSVVARIFQVLGLRSRFSGEWPCA